MNAYSVWLDVLKIHGIPTLLLLVGVVVAWKWYLPLKQKIEEDRMKQEAVRLDNEAKHNSDLVAEIRQTREEGRAERDALVAKHEVERERILQMHRDDVEKQYLVFREMVGTIRSGLDANTQAIGRNSALTVASAEILGAQAKAVAKRADELAPENRPESKPI